LITAASQHSRRRCGFKRRSAGFALPGLPGIPASGPIDGDSAMKSTALLLNLYECIYGFAVAIVLVASGPLRRDNAMTCAGAKADAAMSAVDESGRGQGAVRLSPMTCRLNRSTQHRR
jgi:hypothetical protein